MAITECFRNADCAVLNTVFENTVRRGNKCLETEVITKAKESTRETEGKLDGKNNEGHEREEPARRPVGR
jgi:hypothetical protein